MDLAEQTRGDYQKVLDYLKPIGGTALIAFDKPLVVRIRNKAAALIGRRFGNYVKTVLSILFGWGSERGFLKTNPADVIRDIRRKKSAPEANRPWSDAERHAALMMLTGLGPKDALTLPRNFYKASEIATRRAKTGEPVFWPAPAELVAIRTRPQHTTPLRSVPRSPVRRGR